MADKSKMKCNSPQASDRSGKKKMVKACDNGQEKLIHYGADGYKHNYSAEAKKSFRARHNCDEATDKLSARHWACKDLWPKNDNNYSKGGIVKDSCSCGKCYNEGGIVPGKEIVKNDSEKNDIVKANLSAGEMVIPKTVVKSGVDSIAAFAKKELERINMSDGGVVVPKFEDTQPIFEETSAISDEDNNQLSSSKIFQKGLEQGTTLGFADELAGGVQGILDDLSQFIPGSRETPNEINARLKQQGFTGDLGDTYTTARDEARQDYKTAQEQSNGEYLAGNIAGGALTMAVPAGLGAKMMQPFGSAAKTAPVMEKARIAAINAIPVGAAIGLGTSEAETIGGQVGDTIEGASTGALVSGGLNLAGQGLSGAKTSISNFVDKKMPTIGRAYEKGTQGINTLSNKFSNKVNQQFNEIIEKVKSPILQKRQAILERNQQLDEPNKKLIGEVSKQVKNVVDDLNNYKTSLSEKASGKIETAKIKYGEQITDKLIKTKNNVRSSFDAIENQLDDADVTFNVNQEISEYSEDLATGGLLPEQVDALSGRFLPYFEKGQLTLPELRQLKIVVNKNMQSANPAIRSASKKMYGRIAENQIKSIEDLGFKPIADRLKEVNQKYITVLDLEDELAGTLQRDRVLKKTLVDNTLIQNLNKFIKDDASSVNTTNILREKSQALDPNFGNLIENIYGDLRNKAKMAKFYKDVPSSNNKQLQDLQNLVEQLKTTKAPQSEVNTQVDKLMNSSPLDIENYLRQNLKQIDNPIDEAPAKNIKDVLAEYTKLTGDKNITQETSNVVKDIDLVKNASEEIRGMVSPRSLGALESLGQYPANLTGRIVNKVNAGVQNVKSGTQTMQNVFKDDVSNIITNLKRFNTPEADAYAKQLMQASGSQESKNAAIFSLMQQPAFRKMMNVDNKEK